MIIDRCQVKTKQNAAGLAQFVGYTLSNVALHLDFVVVRQTVHFMNEHLKFDIQVDFIGFNNGKIQHAERIRIIILSIDHEHQRIARAEQFGHFAGAECVQFAGQRVDREKQQRIGLDVVLYDLVARFFVQKDGLFLEVKWN